jgi:branched-chain amino acid transport system substrate-binding protein
MEKRNIYLAIIVLGIVGTGVGFGVYYGILLSHPTEEEEQILLFFGSGLKKNYTMSMKDLKSNKYTQVENQLFYTLDYTGNITIMGYYSGVSLRSILEEENLLEPDAESYTGIAWDYNPGATYGMLNISNVMNNPEYLCIIAYSGTDFDPLEDDPLRLMINQSIVAPNIRASRYCVSNLSAIYIEVYESYEYEWSSSDCPGAPTGINVNQIIKIGCAGDTGTIQGDANWEGAWFAAKQINEAGGVVVNGTTYYVGVVREDTDESNPNLVASKGVDAAERLVYDYKIQYAIGGFTTEAVLAYQEVFMDNKIIFIDTGVATDIFCANVKNYYERYKYFFRFMPINSTSLGKEILPTLAGYIMYLNASYPNFDVRQVGILAEDLTWVDSLIAAVENYISLFTAGWAQMLPVIRYNITLSASDMNAHLATLEAGGCDFLVPVISAQGGILMMQQYALNQYHYQIFGIDVQSQLDTFYDDSGSSCGYETMMQTLYRTNKTETSIEFWDAFIAEFSHEPLYIAVGAYDGVNALIDAINATHSFDPEGMIAYMETWTKATPRTGSPTAPEGAWWPDTHDLVEGYPYGFTLWCQWRADGSKVVIPAPRWVYVDPYGAIPIAPLYPDSLATGAYEVAPWVHTAWGGI